MTLPFTDNFTAADGTDLVTYNSNYTYCKTSGYSIIINTNAYCGNLVGRSAAFDNSNTYANDQFGKITLKALTTQEAGLCLRGSSGATGNFYSMSDWSAGQNVAKCVADTVTQLGVNGPGLSVNDTAALMIVGWTLFPYRNDVLVQEIGPQTDAGHSLSSGSPGPWIWGSGTGTRADDIVLDSIYAEAKAPDSIAASTNLSGAVTDIDEDPDSPGADWMTASDATAATDIRVTFPTPTGNPYVYQDFNLWLRKTTGSTNPTIDVMLYQGGSLVATLLNDLAITSTSGQQVHASWLASQLSGTLDGSDVECRVVSTPGSSFTLPVLSSTVGAGSTSTSPFSNTVLTSPAHAVGDLLVVVCGTYNTNNNGVLTGVNGTGGSGGWTLQNNSGSGWGGAQSAHVAGFGYKIAASTSEVASVTCTGSGTDRYSARVFKITSASGFAATPIANIGSANTGSGTSLGMPTVSAGGSNELAIALSAAAVSTAIASATGESGGDWTEIFGEYAQTNLTIEVQRSDQSGGGGISGGTAAITSGVWCSVGFRVVPASSANTVEIGAVEWNVSYTPPVGEINVPAVDNMRRLFEVM